MSGESKKDRLSPKTLKRRRGSASGPQEPEGAQPGSKLSTNQSAPLNSKSLLKAAPRSGPAALTKESKQTTTVSKGSVVDVDASGNTVTIKKERIFGTDDDHSTNALARQVLGVTTSNGKQDIQNLKWALATVHGIGPKDSLEGLLAVQMIGVHNLAMQCLRRASLEGQTFEGMDANVNRAVRLLRTFTSQMEALNRHRGKVGQQMVVGNVNVSDGGQAIVGPVSQPGAGKVSAEDDAKKVK
jgi:hypothetical protein